MLHAGSERVHALDFEFVHKFHDLFAGMITRGECGNLSFPVHIFPRSFFLFSYFGNLPSSKFFTCYFFCLFLVISIGEREKRASERAEAWGNHKPFLFGSCTLLREMIPIVLVFLILFLLGRKGVYGVLDLFGEL